MSLQKTNPSSLKVLRKEADAICQRFASFKNVIGTIVIDSEGLPFRSTFVKHEAFIYAEMGHQIASRALTGIEKINPEESVEMVKIITGSQEAMIFPDKSFTLMVIQKIKPTPAVDANEQGPFIRKTSEGEKDRYTEWGPYYSSESEDSNASLESSLEFNLSDMGEHEENAAEDEELHYYDTEKENADSSDDSDEDEIDNDENNENDTEIADNEKNEKILEIADNEKNEKILEIADNEKNEKILEIADNEKNEKILEIAENEKILEIADNEKNEKILEIADNENNEKILDIADNEKNEKILEDALP